MCTCLKISPFIQKKKKIPAGLKPLEVSLALTESAKEIGLESSTAARHLTNFIKRYFSRELAFVSSTNLIACSINLTVARITRITGRKFMLHVKR